MKLLFITDNFPPEVNAPATRTYEHCIEWQKQGVEVTVVTCFPNFPKGKVFEGFQNKLYSIEEMNGIKVIRVWSFIAANKGFLKRILDFISYAIMAFLAGLFIKTDIIVTTSPQFFTNFTGLFLKWFKQIPWIMEVRDIWPESIRSVGALKNNLAYNILEWFELEFYNAADKVIVVTNSFVTNLSNRGIDKRKIEVIFNGVNLENFDSEIKNNKNSNELTIAYIGTHGMAHKLDFILDCAVDLQKLHPEIKLLFVGDGAKKESLMLKAKELKLRNVEFRDPVARTEVPSLLAGIDFGLVNLAKSDTFKDVIPSKMFEISAVGKPILMGVGGEAKHIVETYNAGICFEPENKQSFLDGIEKVKTLKAKFDTKEIDPHSLANNFNRKKLASKMLEFLQETYKNTMN